MAALIADEELAAQIGDEELPHLPAFAEEVERIDEWKKRADKYLEDTSTGSLQAYFVTLQLDDPSNMAAALSLLGDTNKGKVIRNTRNYADKLVSTKKTADLKQTKASTEDHRILLQPPRATSKTREYTMSIKLAKVAFRVVMSQEKVHSDEFENVKGQHSRDLGVVICILFEALLDYRDHAHDGDFLQKFSTGLPSRGLSPIPSSSIGDTELPFTPKVLDLLATKKSWTKVALKYLNHSLLFSYIHLLDLNHHKTRKTIDELLAANEATIFSDIRRITRNAMTKLNTQGGYQFSRREVVHVKI